MSWREMGAPYPQERGGAPRVLSCPGQRQVPDDTRIIHPAWTPQAPRTLSPRTIEMARRLDQCLQNYGLRK